MAKQLLTIFEKIDKILCTFMGLEQEESHPDSVQMVGKKLVVTSTSSFKRHAIKEVWEELNATEIEHISPENRAKLGLAAGKAIAKNLVISFEDAPINRN